MEKTEACTILGVPVEASRSEVETAFHKRTREVRARFDAARGMSLRAQYQREFASICDAQDCLLSELVEMLRRQPGVGQPLIDDSQIDERIGAPEVQPRQDWLQVDEAMVHERRVVDARVDESPVDVPYANEPDVHELDVHEPYTHELHVHESHARESHAHEPHVHKAHAHEPRAEEPMAEGPRVGEQPITLLRENHTSLVKDPKRRPQSATEATKRLENAIPLSDIPTATATPPLVKLGTSSCSKLPPSVPPATRKRWLPISVVIIILLILSAAGFLALHHPAESPSPEVSPTPSPEVSPTPSPEVSPMPSPEASPIPSPEVSPAPSRQETGIRNEGQDASPSPAPLSQQVIDATKADVIKRILALPGVSAQAKANLIAKMDRARSMELLTVIPFNIGQTILHRAAADKLVKTFKSSEMGDKLSDPTVILVVAGYADTGGRTDLNLRLSQGRADQVARILKERAKLLNAMQTMGMGGTELLDSRQPAQNRAVEVWVVVPK